MTVSKKFRNSSSEKGKIGKEKKLINCGSKYRLTHPPSMEYLLMRWKDACTMSLFSKFQKKQGLFIRYAYDGLKRLFFIHILILIFQFFDFIKN